MLDLFTIRNSQCTIQYVIVCLRFASTSSRIDSKMCAMVLHWFKKCKKKKKICLLSLDLKTMAFFYFPIKKKSQIYSPWI